jgi:hypothetical protein
MLKYETINCKVHKYIFTGARYPFLQQATFTLLLLMEHLYIYIYFLIYVVDMLIDTNSKKDITTSKPKVK